MATIQRILNLAFLVFIQLVVLSSAKNEDLKCGICRAVVQEINLVQKSADPKKKTKVGSFRVDSRGNQQTREIPESQSQAFLYEAFEKLCERMPQWGVLVDKDTKKRAVIRKYNMEGAMVDGLDKDAQLRLTSLCNDFVEDYEEDAIPVFQSDVAQAGDSREKELCVEKLEICTEEEVKYHSEAQSKGIRDAIMKQAASGKDTLNVSPGGAMPGIVNPEPEDENEDDEEFEDDKEDEIVNMDSKDEL